MNKSTRKMLSCYGWIMLLAVFLSTTPPTDGFVGGALTKVQKDFLALTRRVTAHHIVVSNEEIALALKRKIRDEPVEKELWIVDVFETAARQYSQDDASNVARGGLLGTLVPQGFCAAKCPQLDRACFEVPLGTLEGPIKTNIGYHLLLVTERTNCPKLDGSNTKLVQQDAKDIFGTLSPSAQVGKVTPAFVISQVGYWFLIFIAGGIVAELAAQLTSP